MSQNNVEGFRLSPQQRHVWSLQQVSAFPIYQVLSTISINGNLSAEILERAVADVVRRHEILRTTFQRPSGIKIPFQVISDAARLSLQFSDLSNLDHERQRGAHVAAAELDDVEDLGGVRQIGRASCRERV